MILGLDIGSNSVGWALLESCGDRPTGIIACGVRCFDAGVEGMLDQGRDEPRSAKRTAARQQRRQAWRRQRRQKSLFRLLQRYDLLPATTSLDPTSIHDCLQRYDANLRTRDPGVASHVGQQTVLYRLRERAASERLERHDVGRALYHLAQRRGFLSNRKQQPKDNEEDGQVKAAIADLGARMTQAAAPTLGAFLATLDPDEERIRARWTARRMYEDEFKVIWETQTKHHPDLDDAKKRDLHDVIFHQRPLANQKHLIGKCELEPGTFRAPLALPIAQRFRLLQGVNHLRVIGPGGAAPGRSLDADERSTVIDILETAGDQTFAALRRLLQFPRTARFSIEEGGEKRISGNRTVARMVEIFGARWDEMTPPQQSQAVDDLRSIESLDGLRRRGARHWGLSGDALEAWTETTLEEGHAAHSVAAMSKLVPLLENGSDYSTARQAAYPSAFRAAEPLGRIPPIRSSEGFPEIRNPAVERALTELRKIVNAIVAKHGTPEIVRIELARDLKRSRMERRKISREMREREAERNAAAQRLLREIGFRNAGRMDVERLLLAQECNFTCPYTGTTFGMRDLVGDHPKLDVEHILPFSRSLDNSMANKTLCMHDENRHAKRNRTPFEAYGGTSKWDDILRRVRDFKTPLAREKFRRFTLESVGEELADEFSSRQLNDTRYASRIATEYVGRLYGGAVDASGNRRVQVSAGRATAWLRGRWNLNGILGTSDEKNRSDHRHHAVDAIAIACTGPKEVKRLTEAAEESSRRGSYRLFVEVDEPWSGFSDDARRAIDGIVVSHRTDHRLNGALHEETLYGKGRPRRSARGDREVVRHQRKLIDSLSASDIQSIVDPGIQARIRAALAAAGTSDPTKAFKEKNAHPRITARDGREIAIHRVRIAVNPGVAEIGRGPTVRHVKPGSNHHMAIVAVLDPHGNETKWEGHVVTRLEAMGRWRHKQPVVQRDFGEGRAFKFSICSGDSVKFTAPEIGMCVVRMVSGKRIEVTRLTDGRTATEIRKAGKAGGRLEFGIDAMRKAGCEKVSVSALGEVIACRD